MSRFDYIKYDETSIDDQQTAKRLMTYLEDFITGDFKPSREQSLALTKLEESYMWIGKMIRNSQIEREGKYELEEERTNS